MALRSAERAPAPIVLGTAHGETPEQQLPFVLELPARNDYAFYRAHGADLGAVKAVAARQRLFMDGAQVGADGIARTGVRAKALELRVMAIAFGLAPQHRPRQQRLSPQRDEPLRVEIAGMERPQPH